MSEEQLEDLEQSYWATAARITAEQSDVDNLRDDLQKRQRDLKVQAAVLSVLKACRDARQSLSEVGLPRFLPTLLAPVPFVALSFLVGRGALAVIVAVVLLLVSSMAFCLPADTKVTQLIHHRETKLRGLTATVNQLRASIASRGALVSQLRFQSRAYASEIENIRNSREHVSRQLYEQRWKEMRGEQFENYLAEVFGALRCGVKQTGKSGDQGVDLIVVCNGKRVAIQQLRGFRLWPHHVCMTVMD